MIKFLRIALISLVVTSCSILDPLDVIKPDKPLIEANVNIGKNVEQEKSNIKLEQGNKDIKQEADVISNDHKYEAKSIKQITQNIPLEYLLVVVLLAGWAIPSPRDSYTGFKIIISDIFNAVIIVPLKGCKNILLTFKK